MTERSPEFLAQFKPQYGLNMSKRPADYSRCAGTVYGDSRWPSFHQCTAKNGHGPHGAWCKRHDPGAVSIKREAAYAKYRAESEARTRQWNFERDCQAAVRVIAAGHNDPRGLAQSIIDKLEAPNGNPTR